MQCRKAEDNNQKVQTKLVSLLESCSSRTRFCIKELGWRKKIKIKYDDDNIFFTEYRVAKKKVNPKLSLI